LFGIDVRGDCAGAKGEFKIMTDITIGTGKTTATVATTTVVPQYTPILTRGQKYVSPEGRHSKQTHRRAEARGSAAGHANEKEQHAHDRQTVEAEIDRIAQAKSNQRAQNVRGAAAKA
jgi:hypothetical protein